MPKEILCKGLRRAISYAPGHRYALVPNVPEIYSLVAFGRCNLSCKFCFSGGAETGADGVFPDAQLIPIEVIEDFVLKESMNGRAIRFSGGEPTLFSDIVIHLSKIIRNQGGFSILDTNGTLPLDIYRLAPFVDLLSVDSVKDEYSRVEMMTGRPIKVCWDPALETIHLLDKLPCFIEYKTVIFDHTRFEFLEFLSNLLPRNVEWTLKQYQATKCRFPANQEAPIERLNHKSFFKKPSPERLFSLARGLVTKTPDLNGRLQVVVGPSRTSTNFTRF